MAQARGYIPFRDVGVRGSAPSTNGPGSPVMAEVGKTTQGHQQRGAGLGGRGAVRTQPLFCNMPFLQLLVCPTWAHRGSPTNMYSQAVFLSKRTSKFNFDYV